jgi:3',5'-cyclic AMP phosphodiesterase CpdA
LYALPANHDLWGEKGTEAWERLVGPLRQKVNAGPLTFVLWDDIQRREDGKGWKAMLKPAQREWLERALKESRDGVVVAQHCPPLPVNGAYHDQWRDSNADDLLDLLAQHEVLALVSGHWHRNGEWTARGVRVINTGALCGWQYNAIPPYMSFPTRPGYRLFHWDGDHLRSFWRDGSYWTAPAPAAQVTVTHIGPAHTGGPRPQVRPVHVMAPARVSVSACARRGEVAGVEWSLSEGKWRPMRRVFQGPWSEWEDVLDPSESRAIGGQVLVARALTSKPVAYDAVPVQLAERECSAEQLSVFAGREIVYELFYPVR